MSLYSTQGLILNGVSSVNNNLDFILNGKTYQDNDFILSTRIPDEAFFLVKDIEGYVKRFSLFDKINLRDTSVYRSPRDISILKLVYGNYSNVKVPCTALNEDGTIYHISDRPIMLINKVYVDGEPISGGYRAYTSYQDETGKAIACIVFDNPQYDKAVSVSCKGIINIEDGTLIDSPADKIKDLMFNTQGYDKGSVDTLSLSLFKSDCLNAEIITRCIIDEVSTLRVFFDELAKNIHARWLISDGKFVMCLRWV